MAVLHPISIYIIFSKGQNSIIRYLSSFFGGLELRLWRWNMIDSEIEMKGLGRKHPANTHNKRSLIRTSHVCHRHSAAGRNQLLEKYKHTHNTHTHTHQHHYTTLVSTVSIDYSLHSMVGDHFHCILWTPPYTSPSPLTNFFLLFQPFNPLPYPIPFTSNRTLSSRAN